MTTTGKAFRISARSTSGEVVSSDSVDRKVFAYVKGEAQQRIGFSSDETTTTESGFLIPEGGIEFILAADDPIYLTGQTSAEGSYVFFLVTRVV